MFFEIDICRVSQEVTDGYQNLGPCTRPKRDICKRNDKQKKLTSWYDSKGM